MLVLLGAATDVVACSRSFPTYKVKSEFVVSVTYHEKPVSGIEVEISREVEKPDFHFEIAVWDRTDDYGQVHAQGLAPGRYLIVTRHMDIEGDEAFELEVSKSPDAVSKLGMAWPAHTAFTLRQIAGILASDKDIRNPFKQSEPLSGASVLLLDAKSGQQIGATVANDQGHFSFDASVEPGLYVLRIS